MWKKHKVLLIILIVIVVFAIGKDVIVKVATEQGVKAVTGLKLRISSFRVKMLKSIISIKGLKLYNPSGYKDKVMVDIPEIYVDYTFSDIIKGYLHFPEIRLHLKEFVVVKNEKGELNLDSLKVVEESKEEKAKPKTKKKEEPKKPSKGMKIDLLKLKAEKVYYKDYTKTPPSIKEYDVNIDVEYKDVTSMTALVQLIMTKVLMNTAIANLSGFDIGGLEDSLKANLGSGYDMKGITAQFDMGDVEKKVDEVVKGASKALSGLLNK